MLDICSYNYVMLNLVQHLIRSRNKFGMTISLCMGMTILLLSCNVLAKDELNVRDSLYKQQIEHMRKNMNSPEQIQKAAKEYEAVAVTKMLQQMYSDVKIDPLFDNKNTESIYKDLLLTEYGKIVAENGGIGLAKSLAKDIQKEKK